MVERVALSLRFNPRTPPPLSSSPVCITPAIPEVECVRERVGAWRFSVWPLPSLEVFPRLLLIPRSLEEWREREDISIHPCPGKKLHAPPHSPLRPHTPHTPAHSYPHTPPQTSPLTRTTPKAKTGHTHTPGRAASRAHAPLTTHTPWSPPALFHYGGTGRAGRGGWEHARAQRTRPSAVKN